MKDSTYKIQGTTNVLVDIGCRTSGKRVVSVYGFTRPGLKPTIYCTRGEHSNHYTTEVNKCIRTRFRKINCELSLKMFYHIK